MKFLMVVCCLLLGLPQANALSSEQEILRLKKGEYYFYYLTEDYPSALALLEPLREHQSLGQEFDIMQADMLLALGLHAEAQRIFEQIQPVPSSPQSWFYLVRRWFELGEFYNVLHSAEQIDALSLKAESQTELQFMMASSYMELGEHIKAQKIIEGMPRSAIWTGYARHNYIIAMMGGNTSGRSLKLLIEDAIFYLPETPEAKDLRDRIHLISAIHFVENGENQSALKHLKLISLEGPYTPAALLQYGWVNFEQGNYQRALQPWRELQTRFNLFDPDVMESMLGIPQVFELMKSYTQAIKSYESIEKRLVAMKQFVSTTKTKLETAAWLDSWISVQTDPRWGWHSQLNSTLPFSDESGLLHQLLSEDLIVNGLYEYRDLVMLAQYVEDKEQDLLLWQAMLVQRKSEALNRDLSPQFNRAQRIILESEKAYAELLTMLNDSDNDVSVLATRKQQGSLKKLTQASLNLEQLMTLNSATRNVDLYQQRWARINGVLLWQVNEMKPSVQWQLQRDVINSKRYIAQAENQLLETRLADKWSGSSWQGLTVRLNDALQKTSSVKESIEKEKIESKNRLIAKAQQFLALQEQRITDYLARSRLSIARLYDEALQRKIARGDVSEIEVRP